MRVHNHEDRILFLNFDRDFRNSLSAVVFDDNFRDFDPFEGVDALDVRLTGKQVKLKGRISRFQNRLQLVLRGPEQILEVEGEEE